MRYFLLFILLQLSGFLLGQKVNLSGIVTDSTGSPLEMANVLVLNAADSTMVVYGFTNHEGKYKLTLPQEGNYLLRVSYLGFQQSDLTINVLSGLEDFVQNVTLKQESGQLSEVEIVEDMPIVISGDTISYKAEAFADGSERKLDDVLENLPGFEVDEDGNVKVEGKQVEKVLVEGKEFFDGDTKLATKNIPASAVDKVQVLRNYSDVGPMQGVDTEDRVALNIKLKEGKKRIVFGDIGAEGGTPDGRYLVHPNLFYHSPKLSLNFIGDINNIGEPAFTYQDYFRFGAGGIRNINRRSGSGFSIATDNLGFSMTANNRANEVISRLGALNFNWNPNNSWTISGFLIGSGNEIRSTSINRRTFLSELMEDREETLITRTDQESSSAIGKFSVKYAPRPALHLEYDAHARMSASVSTDNQLSINDSLLVPMRDHRTQHPHDITQTLNFFYEINETNIFSVEAQHLYKYQDPFFQLEGAGAILSSSDSLGLPPLVLNQNKHITTHKIDAVANHYYILNKTNHLNFGGGISHARQTYTSDLMANRDTFSGGLFENDAEYWLTDLYLSGYYKVKLGKLTLNPGLNLHRYQTSDRQAESEKQILQEDIYLLPDFTAIYDIRKSSRLRLSYSMIANYTDINNILNSYVLNSYNTFYTGNRLIDNSLQHSFSLSYSNFNMFNYTNIYAGANYNRSINGITNRVVNDGLLRALSPINSQGVNDMVNSYVGYSKRFGKLQTRIGGRFTFTNTETFIDFENNRTSSLNQNYYLSLRSRFKKAPNLELGYSFSNNKYQGANVSSTFINHRPSAELDAVFLKHFTLEAEYNYNIYYNVDGSSSTNYDFLNASLYYRNGDSPWELSLRGLNLLNTQVIRQDSFSDFLISTTTFEVLPRFVLLGVRYHL